MTRAEAPEPSPSETSLPEPGFAPLWAAPAVAVSADPPVREPPIQTPRRVPRPLILLPTLNEAEGLAATLAELGGVRGFPAGRAPDVLVVDGHSTDGTREVADRWKVRSVEQSGRGKGRAIRDGLATAVAEGYTAIGVLDADGTYPADRLPALFDLLEVDADVVAGVRRPTAPSGSTTRNLVHRVGNGLLNLTAAQLSRGPILDVCTGFWGVRASAVSALDLRSDGFEVESELFVKSVRRGLRVVQIPIDYRTRIGEAKLHAVRDGARILRSILRHSLADTPSTSRTQTPGRNTAARPKRTPLVHAVATLLCAFPLHPVVVVSGSGRRAEATQMARTVETYRPGAVIWTEVANPISSFPTMAYAAAESIRHGGGRAVVVTLPDAPDGEPAPDSALVRILPAGRTLLVQSSASSSNLPSGFAGGTDVSVLGCTVVRHPRAFEILGASLDTSGASRELSVVAANGAGAPVELFELHGTLDGLSDPSAPPGSEYPTAPASIRSAGRG